MKASLKYISEQSGFSKTTVSFVLNGRGDEKNISKETQEKVKRLANDLGYRPSHIARSLSMGKSQTIGFIVPDISNPFFAGVGKFVEEYAEHEGYSVMFASSNEDKDKEKHLLNNFISRQIDGIIIAPTHKMEQFFNGEGKNTPPMVFFDRVYPGQKKSFTDIDNFEATRRLTCELIKRGHKKVALLGLTSYLPNIAARIEGYKAALAEKQIQFDKSLVFEIDFYNKRDGVKKAITDLFEKKPEVSGIVFLNNMLTAEGIWVSNKYYPEKINEIEFASFDDLELFDFVKPKVISVTQPVSEIALSCIEQLFRLINKDKEQDGVLLDTSLIIR